MITSFRKRNHCRLLDENKTCRTRNKTDIYPKRIYMGFDQYHEPPRELSQETRTIARMLASLTEEAEAINWYEQRISVEKDKDAKAIMQNAQEEEFKHFGMDLEFLLRKMPKWKITLQAILFQSGDIVKLGERGEHNAE